MKESATEAPAHLFNIRLHRHSDGQTERISGENRDLWTGTSLRTFSDAQFALLHLLTWQSMITHPQKGVRK
jgi:hypothetical protein